MTDLRDQLRASAAAAIEDDGDFVEVIRAYIDARPLSEPGLGVLIEGDAAARLVRLANEALRSRRTPEAPPQIGAKGRLVALVDRDDRARLIAEIEFSDEDALRQAGALIACAVSIEPVFDTDAANESTPGQGSLNQESETSP